MTTPTQRLIAAARQVLYETTNGRVSSLSPGSILSLRDALAACEEAGDEPNPTPWAYEQACKALHTWRAKADERRAAMVKAQDDGCVDHLDCCDDAGDFWHMALNDPPKASP